MKYILLLILVCIFVVSCTSEKPIGGETDEHGCMLMAGYTWCEAKQKCLRTWEEFCDIESKAKEFCDNENKVYVCSDYIRVVSIVPGAGSTFYKADMKEVKCPVVAPDSMTEECKQLTFEPDCEEKEIC